MFLQQHRQWNGQQQQQQQQQTQKVITASPTDSGCGGERSVSSEELLEPSRVSAFHPSGVVAKDNPRAATCGVQQQQGRPTVDPTGAFVHASNAVNAMLALQHGPSSDPETQAQSSGENQKQEGDDVDQLFTFNDDESETAAEQPPQGFRVSGTSAVHDVPMTPSQLKHQQMMMIHMKYNPQTSTSSAPAASGTSHTASGQPEKSSKANIAFKRSCKVCTERRVKCSGPPGPCVTCLKKGLGRDLCVFLPRRKPGPKKREFDLLLGLNSTLALTDEQFISESVHMVFSEYAVSLQVYNVTNYLRGIGFLAPEYESTCFQNEAFMKKSSLRAIRLWLTLFGEHVLDISSTDFVLMMKNYQEFGGENYDMNDKDLGKLYWLCCPSDELDERTRESAMITAPAYEPRMLLSQLCLAFMWLGPAKASDANDCKATVRSMYDWLHETPQRLCNYEGFCSQTLAEAKLAEARSEIYYLVEGRVTLLQTGSGNFRSSYRIRRLAKAVLKEDSSGHVPSNTVVTAEQLNRLN
jgi:hypothetical protein